MYELTLPSDEMSNKRSNLPLIADVMNMLQTRRYETLNIIARIM